MEQLLLYYLKNWSKYLRSNQAQRRAMYFFFYELIKEKANGHTHRSINSLVKKWDLAKTEFERTEILMRFKQVCAIREIILPNILMLVTV